LNVATKLPVSLPDRIEYVMRLLYGSRWRTKAAAALGIGRMTLHRWMSGEAPQSNVDLDLLQLIASERAARMRLGNDLDKLVPSFLRG
jgi:transcriptional regulator with XRE-family HTH domain